jgi:hypothetical protein
VIQLPRSRPNCRGGKASASAGDRPVVIAAHVAPAAVPCIHSQVWSFWFPEEPGRLRRVENTVEVRYAGVVVGRSAMVRDRNAQGAFVTLAEPLPVGTTVTLKAGDVTEEARVVEVVESADPAAAGMRVHFAAAAPATKAAPEPATAAPSGPGAGDQGAAPEDVSGPVSAATAVGEPGSQPGGGGSGRRRRRRR